MMLPMRTATNATIAGKDILRPVQGRSMRAMNRMPARQIIVRSQEGTADAGSAPAPEQKQQPQAQAKTAPGGGPPPSRPNRKIYPGANERSLSYLTGALPGDFGWDPLHLADTNDQDRLNNAMSMSWLSYAEVIHCRWAMLGAAGAIAPELLGKAAIIPASTGLTWFEAGGLDSSQSLAAVPFTAKVPFQYWTDQYTLLFTMHALMGFAEFRRWQEYKEPGSVQRQWFFGLEKLTPSSEQPQYPGGGFFNFAGFGKDEKEMFDLKTKEIRNGRLAMLAFLGFMVQAQTTHKGPVQNLLDHSAAPLKENIFVNWFGQ